MNKFAVPILSILVLVLAMSILFFWPPGQNVVTDEPLEPSSYTCIVSEVENEIIIKLLKVGR